MCSENPVNWLKLKESDIPLDAIYNTDVNIMKVIEKNNNLQSKPLTFNIWKNYKGKEEQHLSRIIKHGVNKKEILDKEYYQVVADDRTKRPPSIIDGGIP